MDNILPWECEVAIYLKSQKTMTAEDLEVLTESLTRDIYEQTTLPEGMFVSQVPFRLWLYYVLTTGDKNEARQEVNSLFKSVLKPMINRWQKEIKLGANFEFYRHTHPRMPPGEIHLFDLLPREYGRLLFNSKRWGSENSRRFLSRKQVKTSPVFVKRWELFNRGFSPVLADFDEESDGFFKKLLKNFLIVVYLVFLALIIYFACKWYLPASVLDHLPFLQNRSGIILPLYDDPGPGYTPETKPIRFLLEHGETMDKNIAL